MADHFLVPTESALNPEGVNNAHSVHFNDPDLEKIIQKYNLKFNSAEELIEVCIVSIAATSHLLNSHQDIHSVFD